MGSACSKGHPTRDLLTSVHLQYRLVRSMHQHFDDLYEVIEVIGEGSTSKISKIKRRTVCRTETAEPNEDAEDMYFALKEIDLTMVRAEFLDELENEIKLLKALDHPHIVKPLETYRLHRNRIAAIVMEKCNGGDLYTRQPCSQRDAATILEQILSAVAYLHDRNIVHRDLKHENIMFVNKDHIDVKLIDFGLAKRYLLKRDRHYEKCGTMYTMSPEALQGNYSGSSTDLWSIGVIAYMLLSNEKPFWGKDPKEVAREIRTKKIVFEGEVWSTVSSDAKDFISKLLQRKPDDRPTAKEALMHKFIRSRNKLSKQPTPELRRSIGSSVVRYAESSRFKQIALHVIANRSSSDEVFELRNAFNKYDTSSTGSLSASDFKACLAQCNTYSDKELDSLFSKVEVNNTGRIMYTEFLASTLEVQGNVAQSKITEAFNHIDRDAKGYIDKDDLRKLLPRTMTDREIDELISEAGADSGGRVSLDQFRRALTCETQCKMNRIFRWTGKVKLSVSGLLYGWRNNNKLRYETNET